MPTDQVSAPLRVMESDAATRVENDVFVWFTRLATADALNNERGAPADLPPWTAEVAMRLADFQERSAQRLVLEPTPRSALR